MLHISRSVTVKAALAISVLCVGVGLSESQTARRKARGFDRASYNSASNYKTAQLKYYPPRNWLRHYLGDDRYKIAGNLWTVLTTETDTYYHRPSCPNMRRQSPNNVIGFFASSLAAEAGYVPDPVCQPASASFVYIGPAGAGGSSGGPITTINRGRAAQRILLADRASSVLLPPNWRRTQSGAQTVAGQSTQMDTLQPLKGRGAIRIGFVTMPPELNIDMSRVFNAQTFRSSFQSFNRSGQVNNVMSNAMNSISVTDARLGGIRGVAITPRAGAKIPNLTGRTIMAARGRKIYMLENSAGNTSGASTIINSFRAR